MSDDTPTLNINGTQCPILCSICENPITERAEAEGNGSNFGCATCGNWAGKDEVAGIAPEYAKREGRLQINRMARDVASGSKIMTFSGDTEHDQSYRFIVHFKI